MKKLKGNLGTSVLVLDHHITDTELSENAVIINNQLSPNYKNKELTGAGVVYQFCRYLGLKLGNPLLISIWTWRPGVLSVIWVLCLELENDIL